MIMKKIAVPKRFIFTLFAVLVGVNLLGQSSLSGAGTSDNPYIIASETDWNYFANKVNTGEAGYATAHYKLTDDISVTTMVGTPEHPFSGTFTGEKAALYGAYTLTFNCGSSYDDATNEEIVAPFRYTDGATIRALILRGAIHTIAGKEAGLIGVNNRTSTNTTVEFIINHMNFYCYEILWNEEGGGYAYDGSGVSFSYCSYEGTIVASNYHGGFCGKANGNTTFTRCLFDPEGGYYWAENFVYDAQGAYINYNGTDDPAIKDGCYYSLGNNQQPSKQGTMIFVNEVPQDYMGHKITTFHEKKIYEPVTVVISGVNKRYIYNNGNVLLDINSPSIGVTFDGVSALANNWCSIAITNSSSQVIESITDEGTYTFTVTAPKAGVESDYLGSVTQLIRVIPSTSEAWTNLQAELSGAAETINLNDLTTEDVITAGGNDYCLVVESGRTVTINLNGKTIDRDFYNSDDHSWETPIVGGHVLKVRSGATVIINGPGTIMGGSNKAANNAENAENSNGGGIANWGTLTLNNVTVRDNKCVKCSDNNTSRTARGGGIFSGQNSNITINGCEITNNSAEGGGGGIFVYRAANFTMNKYNSTDKPYIHDNKSKDKGGGIRVDATNSTTATLNDSRIENNVVEFYSNLSVSNGGGIHLDAGNLTLNSCEIKNNQASKYGGGIYMMGGQLHANGCTITGNKAYDATSRFDGCGGGICILGGGCYLNGATITGNSSSVMDGGGIFVEAGKVLSIQGTVNITGNWKYNSNTGSSTKTTNVYLMSTNGRITIAGNITGTIGVSKNGDTGIFTTGLNGHGTIANFSSDNPVYKIELNNNEAKFSPIDPEIPPLETTWTINTPTILNESLNNTIKEIVIGDNGCLYVNTGGYINGVIITNNTTNAENKLVINGGQVNPSNSGVPATVIKDIKRADASNQKNWYLISSPLVDHTDNSISIRENTNLIVKNFSSNNPEYDLYRFNEGATQTDGVNELQWENYRSTSPEHSGFNVNNHASPLEKGRGYLYRNINDYTITMIGAINIESPINYTLSYHAEVNGHDNVLKGFNIIGNPYAHNISKGVTGAAIPNTYLENKYYVLNQENGSWVLTDDGTAIPPMTGILVQAKSAGTLAITNSTTVGASKGVANNNIWFTVANSEYDDRVCVIFKEGHGLNKIAHINEDVPMLYIRHNDEDFASVDMNPEAKQFDLYFEAATMGVYKLNVNPQGNYSYLHLIDKVAGKDIDLLLDGEYSFIGVPSDIKDRFVVRLSKTVTDGSGDVIFAYQNGNDIVVYGEGTLQVFDVTGRLVANQRINGVEIIQKPSQTGVYIFRLDEMTQKMVVR